MMLRLIAFAILAVALRHASAVGPALGISLYTWHAPESHDCSPCGLDNNTQGLYVIAEDYTFGYVRNSYRRPAWYVGRLFAVGRIDLTVGAITGYQKRLTIGQCQGHGRCYIETGYSHAVLRPLVAASYRIDLGPLSPRLTLLGNGLHLSMEYAL
jgi:hypothetical protein